MISGTPWIVVGGGGHASVVIDTLLLLGEDVLGFTGGEDSATSILGAVFLGGDEVITSYEGGAIHLANGLGSIGSTKLRAAAFRRFKSRGYTFPCLVHPSAIVAASATIGEGTQVMAGAILQPNCCLAENVLINTAAHIDHDCIIESDVHVAPGAALSGGVVIGSGSHIGLGANVIQGVHIGAHSTIGAGAVVLRDVPAGATVVGVPAAERGI